MSGQPSGMGSKTKENEGDSGERTPLLNGSFDALLTPELLYKMNKKIVQLTKVIYGLNTRGEELESQLHIAKESEEKTKTINADLQQRVNTFKIRIETEMGRLRDLEAQAQQSQIWKMECENLKRRLETEGLSEGGISGLSQAREEVEQGRRREAALQFELDQARHAISNLKAHHDFIMRERDAQQAMEGEKVVLEWQSRMAELESRYKAQNRRLTDEFEVLKTECEVLRGRVMRASSSAGEEPALRDQIRMLQLQKDTDRREWEMKLKRKNDEVEEERMKLTQERLDMMRKSRARTEEDDGKENLQQQMRLMKESYEARIRDMTANQELLQHLVDDREEECEVKLKTKVVEWKSEWDLAEGGLREEICKLKNENHKLQAEVSALKLSMESSGVDFVSRIAKLEDDLEDKTNELELKTKNFKVRLGMVENENKQHIQEKKDLEKRLGDENERYKVKLKNHETMNERIKIELQTRLQQAKDQEKILKEACKVVEEENDSLKEARDELLRRIKEKEREWEEKLEYEVKTNEARIRKKVERTWIEKLKRTEESAAYDLDRAEEERKRQESLLKREIEAVKNSEEEIRTSNEELKQKLRELGRRETERTKSMKRIEEELEKKRKTEDEYEEQKRQELAIQESKYQTQIDDLTLRLAEQQQMVAGLTEKLSEGAKENVQCNNSKEEALQIELEEMMKEVKLKENMTESVKTELLYAKNETTIAKMKVQRLEEDLSQAKESVSSLQEQNASRARDTSKLKELETRVKSLEEELRKSEAGKKDLQEALNEIEAERDEELKIVQDALDEAAQEREELITTFEKELKHLNTTNTVREQQMLEDFEWKLREMEKDHKKKLQEKERQMENTLQRVKCHTDDEEFRQKLEKMKSEISAKWEDKLRAECSRLKSELDELHSEEKHLAVESMKLQKEQEMQTLKKSWERSQEEMTKEISALKDSLTSKDAYYHKEMDSQRTIADRDIWDLRMKLQKLNEASYDKQQMIEEKHRELMERFRVDFEDRIRELESKLATRDAQAGIDLMAQLEKEHKHQMQHLEEQHKLSMERLREELESDKFQAVEEARLIISKNHEYAEANLKEQIAEYARAVAQYREELESLRATLVRKDENVRSLREQIEKAQEYRGKVDPLGQNPHGGIPSSPGLSSSQFSLASSTDSQGSRGSRSSHERFYLSENTGVVDGHDNGENGQRASTPGILGKVFGVGWFAAPKGRETGRRGSTPISSKKTYGS